MANNSNSNSMFWLNNSSNSSPSPNRSSFNPLNTSVGSATGSGHGLLSLSSSPLSFSPVGARAQQVQQQNSVRQHQQQQRASAPNNTNFGAAATVMAMQHYQQSSSSSSSQPASSTNPYSIPRHGAVSASPASSASTSPASSPSASAARNRQMLEQYSRGQKITRQDDDDDDVVFRSSNQRQQQQRHQDVETFVPVQSSAGAYLLTSTTSDSSSRLRNTKGASSSSAMYDPRALSLSAARVRLGAAQKESATGDDPTTYSLVSNTAGGGAFHSSSELNVTPPRIHLDVDVSPPRPPMPALSQRELAGQGFASSTQHEIAKLQTALARGHDRLCQSSRVTAQVVESLEGELNNVAEIADRLTAETKEFTAKMKHLSPMRQPQASMPPPGWKPGDDDDDDQMVLGGVDIMQLAVGNLNSVLAAEKPAKSNPLANRFA